VQRADVLRAEADVLRAEKDRQHKAQVRVWRAFK
jgi:hypothetical protein